MTGVLGLGSVYAFFSRRYKSSATGRRRLLQKQLSHLTLGTPQARVYELVGQQPTRVWNLDESSRPGGVRLETFEFPDAEELPGGFEPKFIKTAECSQVRALKGSV